MPVFNLTQNQRSAITVSVVIYRLLVPVGRILKILPLASTLVTIVDTNSILAPPYLPPSLCVLGSSSNVKRRCLFGFTMVFLKLFCDAKEGQFIKLKCTVVAIKSH